MNIKHVMVYSAVLLAASTYALAANPLIARGGGERSQERTDSGEGAYRGGEGQHPGAAGYERGYNQGFNQGADSGGGGGGYYYPPEEYPPPQQQEQQPMENPPYNPV